MILQELAPIARLSVRLDQYLTAGVSIARPLERDIK